MKEYRKRIEIIDGLRGLSVVLMVAHHLLYNIWAFLGAPSWVFSNPAFDVLQPFFAGVFIFLSGVSSRLSRSNIKRGLLAFAVAAAITFVTTLMGMPIIWGVLHLLAFCMVFFGITKILWDKIPVKLQPCIFIPLIIAGAIAVSQITIVCPHPSLRYIVSALGWRQTGFVSFDFFGVVPWLFVFLLGTWGGIYVKDKKLPDWFYEYKIPFFPPIGRKALIIYIFHQPILFAVVMGVRYLFF